MFYNKTHIIIGQLNPSQQIYLTSYKLIDKL